MVSEDTSLSSLSKMNREEEEREGRGGDRTSQKAEAQRQSPCEVILRTGSKSARVLVGKMATEVRGLVCGQLRTLIEPRLSFHRVSIAGRELENRGPVRQIRPATCFVENILLESSHACLCVVFGCFHNARQRLAAKLEIFTVHPLTEDVSHLCSGVWTWLCHGSWVVGVWKFQLVKGRPHTPKYKVTPHVPHPPRVAPSLLDSRGGEESETRHSG